MTADITHKRRPLPDFMHHIYLHLMDGQDRLGGLQRAHIGRDNDPRYFNLRQSRRRRPAWRNPQGVSSGSSMPGQSCVSLIMQVEIALPVAKQKHGESFRPGNVAG